MGTEKKRKILGFICIMLLAAILLCAVLVVRLFQSDIERLQTGPALTKVTFEGNYNIDGGPWQPLTPDTEFDYKELHTITLQGRFCADIPPGQTLMMKISHLRTKISVNGKDVYSFGYDKPADSIVDTSGNTWAKYLSDGISSADDVQLVVENIYRNANSLQFHNFFNKMYVGTEDALLHQMLKDNWGNLLVGAAGVIFGFLLLMFSIPMKLLQNVQARQLFGLSCFSVSMGIAFCMDFDVISLLFPYPVLFNAAYILGIYFILLYFMLYLHQYLHGFPKLLIHLCEMILLAFICIVAFLQMIGAQDLYTTMGAGIVVVVIMLAIILFCLCFELRYKNAAIRKILLTTIPLWIGCLLDGLNALFQGLPSTVWFKIGFCIFAVLQAIYLMQNIKRNFEAEKRAQDLENELVQNKISITLSQIQPHFLYNSLTAISRLCDVDNKKAKKAIVEFSTYLRGNLDSLSRETPVLFEKELNHIQTYLSLEKMRFGDQLNVIYDIQASDFLLPALTIQPLVENAVRYGVGKKENGGTITIATRQTDLDIQIIVRDDGMGFDPSQTNPDDKTHIGIQNVQSRLCAQCGGTLAIESAPGVGTTAIIILPKKGEAT